MFELKEDSAFKAHLRDFLVQTKSFADKNNADLFAEEAAAQREVRSEHLPSFFLTHSVAMEHAVICHDKERIQGPWGSKWHPLMATLYNGLDSVHPMWSHASLCLL